MSLKFKAYLDDEYKEDFDFNVNVTWEQFMRELSNKLGPPISLIGKRIITLSLFI